jgi:hypothetical protein
VKQRTRVRTVYTCASSKSLEHDVDRLARCTKHFPRGAMQLTDDHTQCNKRIHLWKIYMDVQLASAEQDI